MLEKLPTFALYYLVLLFSLSCHEAAHGWMANKFGDPTAKMMGRVSLNPVRHIDPIGTLLLPLLLMFSGSRFLIGWAKPVPVNPYNLKDPRKDEIWISALGPITNVALAIVFALLAWLLVTMLPVIAPHVIRGSMTATMISVIYSITEVGVMLNLALAVFNMIPLHPLDGSGVLRGLISEEAAVKYDQFGRYGMIILMILMVTGVLRYVFVPVAYIANWMLPV